MIDLDIGRGLTPWAQLGAIIAATFVSEDLTCIASGLLIRSRQLDGFVGVAGCFLGIFVGDMGLWLMGRACGRRVLDTAWVRRRVSAARIERMGDWFDRRGWTAIVAARFVPGTRLPVYLGAGMLGRRADRFVLWALLAALVWTPLLVLLVA
ncbi:MAG: VTT domain-containing protein, partial [Phycisphaerae bacterium]|nr:VTT domain-containing protein [Phycisphaerae bacterium]